MGNNHSWGCASSLFQCFVAAIGVLDIMLLLLLLLLLVCRGF